jgi:hypothetical protein
MAHQTVDELQLLGLQANWDLRSHEELIGSVDHVDQYLELMVHQ